MLTPLEILYHHCTYKTESLEQEDPTEIRVYLHISEALAMEKTPCRCLVPIVCLIFLCIFSHVCEARVLTAENGSSKIVHQVFIPQKDEANETDDFSSMDYSPARKKTPIHN